MSGVGNGPTLNDELEQLRAALAPMFDRQESEEAEAWARQGEAVTKRFVDTGATLDTFGGNCPVQAEGAVDGLPFYFRARGDSWELWIGPESDWWTNRAWVIERDYGDGPFDAGWMTRAEALGFVCDGIDAYRASHAASPTPAEGID